MKRIANAFIWGLIIVVNVWANTPKTFGPTKPSDTIWEIATKLRPSEKVTISQVALGIFYNNRHAFYRYNINALDSGKIINLPDTNTIAAISATEALNEVIRQNDVWRKLNAKNADPSSIPLATSPESGLSQTDDNRLSTSLVVANSDIAPTNLPEIDKPAEGNLNSSPSSIDVVTDNNIPSQNTSATTIPSQNTTATNIPSQNTTATTPEVKVEEKKITTCQFQEKMRDFFSQNKTFVMMQEVADRLYDYLGATPFLGILGGIILILLILLCRLIIPRRKRYAIDPAYRQEPELAKEKEEEYDLMTGKEGTAAKLNLARAYIEMEQEDKAQDILVHILLHGLDADQKEAKFLLDSIREKKLQKRSWM